MKVRNWVLIFSLICSLAYGQTSGGGPTTHSPTLSVTDGTNTCYPYQIKVGTNSCTSGVATITTGGGGSSLWQESPGNVGINTLQNVGIGTITPVNNLTVAKTSSANAMGLVNNAGTTLMTLDTNSGSASGTAGMSRVYGNGTYTIQAEGTPTFELFGGDGNPMITLQNSGGWPTSSGYVKIAQNGVDSIHLLADNPSYFGPGDQLSVGTTSAPQLLNVGSTAQMTVDTSGNIVTSGTSTLPTIYGTNIGIGTSLVTTSALTVMDGNVGIGTWVPAYPLSLSSNIGVNTNTAAPIFQSLAGQGSMTFQMNPDTNYQNGQLIISNCATSGGYNTYGDDAFLSLYLGTGSGCATGGATVGRVLFRIGSYQDSNQFVIREESPVQFNYGLNAGSVLMGNTSNHINSANEGANDLNFAVLNGSDYDFYITASQNLEFCTGANGNPSHCLGITNPTMFLTKAGNVGIGTIAPNGGLVVMNGNVGIGTITPGTILDVNGTIRSGPNCLYRCVGGVDAGLIQTSACNICPAGSCTQINICG